MAWSPEFLLVGAVAAVGVLHTMVPDHWAPIALIARQQGWTRLQTVRAAMIAGTGHVLSTLAIAIVVWIAGVAFAQTFGGWVNTLASLALVLFGGWIAISALRDMRRGGHDRGHGHSHDHGGHEHGANPAAGKRTALLLILGSSPMVEGIPAFFAASRYGLALVIVMSLVFAASTIATYVILCVASVVGLERISLGPIERYGEVLSGAFIAVIGVAFWAWQLL
jgi:ABC-type nickel/cobalt efflux system permease component RcnA